MQYVQITLDEMKSFFSNPSWQEVIGSTSTREYVFEKVLNENPKIVVHVYTSIHKDNSLARRKGQDAIRICAVDVTNRKGYIKTTRVLRVVGWRANLSRAIDYTINEANSRIAKSTRNTLQPHPGVDVAGNCEQTFACNPVWVKSATDNSYSICASNLRSNYRRDVCPHCNKLFSKNHLISTNCKHNRPAEKNEKVASWIFRCPHCGAQLTVINL